jgi:hypothetical protein
MPSTGVLGSGVTQGSSSLGGSSTLGTGNVATPFDTQVNPSGTGLSPTPGTPSVLGSGTGTGMPPVGAVPGVKSYNAMPGR